MRGKIFKGEETINKMVNEDIHILLFYKFIPIDDLEYFVRTHARKCKELGIFGKVLVAHEGVNGSVSGTQEQLEQYKTFVRSLPGFADVWFKEEIGKSHPFNKMIVRIREEIVSLKRAVDMTKKRKYVSPDEFLKAYEQEEDFIVLDARNDYEYTLGRFKKAINPAIKTFREFPAFVNEFKKQVSPDKKIFIYCTGGIRCEKASVYMEEQGFSNVHQLQGGIINFCQQKPNTLWEGKCFVFDKRLVSDLGQGNTPITYCVSCGTVCDLLRNCKYVRCDKLVVQCSNCQEQLHGCCSKQCMHTFLQYSKERAEKKKKGEWVAPKLEQTYAI